MCGMLVWTSNPRLVTVTWNTWAENHHSGYWSDTYRGELSINGFEDYVERGVTKYPKWIQIKYNVQGDISKESAYAQGGDTIRKTLIVKDKWNNGPKTTVHYNYAGDTNRLISPMSVSVGAKD